MAGPIPPVRLALAQLNPRVGDLEGNAAKAREAVIRARDEGAEVVLLPELVISGHPAEDLLLQERFLLDCEEALRHAAGAADGVVALIGFPERADDVYDAMAVCADGVVRAVYRKNVIPRHGILDDHRHFQPGTSAAVLEFGGARLGLAIGEDLWAPGPPAEAAALAGAQLLLAAAAAPYHRGEGVARERMLVQRARDTVAAIACCNLVGGQDDLVFDGHSIVCDHEGEVIARAPQFEEAIVHATVDVQAAATSRLRQARRRPAAAAGLLQVDRAGSFVRSEHPRPVPLVRDVAPLLDPLSEIHQALVLATRDHVEKNGFGHACVGLSGGVDTTLVALIAVDALGARNVTGVVLPSRYSAEDKQADARRLAANLGMECLEVPIEPAVEALATMLDPLFADREPDLTEEHLQSRIRGTVLTGLSSKFGWLVLGAGTKSEAAIGSTTTLDGGAGGFAVIKDVLKTRVYELVGHRNEQAGGSLVPAAILSRPPSAELGSDRRADTLPDYDMLDLILERALEHDASRSQLVAAGVPEIAIERVLELVDRNEARRRQQPPGPRVTPRAFGRDRRMPITGVGH